MWCSGRIVDAIIKDLDNNDKADILAVGVDNGFEEIVIFSYEPDTLTAVRLSTKEYTINDYPEAQLKTYIRLAKTDYDKYLGIRMSGVDAGSFRDDLTRKLYTFATHFIRSRKDRPIFG